FRLPGLADGVLALNANLTAIGSGEIRVRITSLSNPDITTVVTATVTSTVPTLAIAPLVADQPEGDAGDTPFTFTVTRSGDTSGATTVNYAVTGVGASQAGAEDFGGTLPSGQVSFAANELAQLVTVNVRGDLV